MPKTDWRYVEGVLEEAERQRAYDAMAKMGRAVDVLARAQKLFEHIEKLTDAETNLLAAIVNAQSKLHDAMVHEYTTRK